MAKKNKPVVEVEVKGDFNESVVDALNPEVFEDVVIEEKKVLFYGVPTCDLVVDGVVVANKGERYEIVEITATSYITKDGVELSNKFVLVRR